MAINARINPETLQLLEIWDTQDPEGTRRTYTEREANVAGEYVTEEEVRRCMDMVRHGECVTFPSGLVIDKRPLVLPAYVPPALAPYPGAGTWPGVSGPGRAV